MASQEAVPSAAQELDRYLAQIPDSMRQFLQDEFGATFMGPVMLPKPEPASTAPVSPEEETPLEDEDLEEEDQLHNPG